MNSAKASNYQAMVLGRILVGVGIGVSSGVVPLYISEVNLTPTCTMWESGHYNFHTTA